MPARAVKGKLKKSLPVTGAAGGWAGFTLVLLAILTFIASFSGIFPADLVESWYSRAIFPRLSVLTGIFADSVPIAWLDVTLAVFLILAITAICVRRVKWLAVAAACLYLVFFWAWGLNYHRTPLSGKLNYDPAGPDSAEMRAFTIRAAEELNRIYRVKSGGRRDDRKIRAEVVARVRRVVARIDGSDWPAASRAKVSLLAGPWFQAAGIDGVFNPIGHEPVISNTLLDVEFPFVMAHELAHVRGYPHEGDANFVAVLATVVSSDAELQYSGWLQLWFYLRSKEADEFLEEGPRRDLARISERIRSERVGWISNFQSEVLDWYLRANGVEEGIQSYSEVATLAAGTQRMWDDFR